MSDEVALIERFVQLAHQQHTSELPAPQALEMKRLAAHLRENLAGGASAHAAQGGPVRVGVTVGGAHGGSEPAASAPADPTAVYRARPSAARPAAPTPVPEPEPEGLTTIEVPADSAYTPSQRPVFARDYFGDEALVAPPSAMPSPAAQSTAPSPTSATPDPVVAAATPTSSPQASAAPVVRPAERAAPAARPVELAAPTAGTEERAAPAALPSGSFDEGDDDLDIDPAALEVLPEASAQAAAEPDAAPQTSAQPEAAPRTAAEPTGASKAGADPEAASNTDAPGRASAPQPGPTLGGSVDRKKVRGRSALVYLRDGSSKRGSVRTWDPNADTWDLKTKAGVERLSAEDVLVAFLGPEPGQPVQAPEGGRRVKVTLTNGKRLVGVTDDYAPERSHFSLVPDARNSGVERVWVPSWAVETLKPA